MRKNRRWPKAIFTARRMYKIFCFGRDTFAIVNQEKIDGSTFVYKSIPEHEASIRFLSDKGWKFAPSPRILQDVFVITREELESKQDGNYEEDRCCELD